MLNLRTIAFITLFASLSQSADAAPGFIQFDVPGAQGTVATNINENGTVTGSFLTTDGNIHGFVRNPNGAFATFDPPGSTQTVPMWINNEGTVTGFFFEGLFLIHQRGFLRDKTGAITVFDVPGDQDTHPAVIANNGVVAGSLGDLTGIHGFVRQKDGSVTTFDPPGSADTEPISISGNGSIGGTFVDTQGHVRGFIRDKDGSLTVVNLPGETLIQGINDAGATVGSDASGGFLRDKNGVVTTIALPDSSSVLPCAINNGGTIAGLVGNSSGLIFGFIRQPLGSFTSIPLPPGEGIALVYQPFLGINNANTVTGTFGNFPGTHGFIFTPVVP